MAKKTSEPIWKTNTAKCVTEKEVEDVFPLIGDGSDDDPFRPDLPDYIDAYSIVDYRGDEVVVCFPMPDTH